MICDKSIDYLQILWMVNLLLNSNEFRNTVLILRITVMQENVPLYVSQTEEAVVVSVVYCKPCFSVRELFQTDTGKCVSVQTKHMWWKCLPWILCLCKRLCLSQNPAPSGRFLSHHLGSELWKSKYKERHTEFLLWSAQISDDHKQISKFGADLNPLQ